MVDFPSAVAVPPTSAYGPPQVDFNWLANLANDYYKGQQNQFNQQQNQQTTALQQAFKGGLPTNPDGTINYQADVADLGAKGRHQRGAATCSVHTNSAEYQERATARSAIGRRVLEPQAQPAPQSQSQQPVGDLPPASAGLGGRRQQRVSSPHPRRAALRSRLSCQAWSLMGRFQNGISERCQGTESRIRQRHSMTNSRRER